MKKFNGIFIGFVIGSAVGSSIALLFAPKKGKYLRNDISRKTGEIIDQGKKLTYNSWNEAKEAAESTFESANDFLNTGVEKIVKKTEKIKDAFKSGIDSYNDERRQEKYTGNLYSDDSEKTKARIT